MNTPETISIAKAIVIHKTTLELGIDFNEKNINALLTFITKMEFTMGEEYLMSKVITAGSTINVGTATEIIEAIYNNSKLLAIKFLREQSGLLLSDCKDIIEAYIIEYNIKQEEQH